MSLSMEDIQALSVEERLRLISVLWDSLADSAEEIPLTDARRREIDRRLDKYAVSPPRLSTWEEVRARIEAED